MKPRQAFDAEREEAAALPRPARRDPALAMAKRQVLVLLGAWLAVRALLMPAALLAGPPSVAEKKAPLRCRRLRAHT